MRRRWRHKFIHLSVWLGLALVVAFSAVLPVGLSVSANGENVSDLSLSQRASELTREFATALSPGSGIDRMYMLEATETDYLLRAGNAGGMLGYADILSDDSSIVGWLMSSYTQSSATITYDQLIHVVNPGGLSPETIDNEVRYAANNNPFYQYAGYGEALNEMGLSATIRPGFSEMGRLVGSGLMLLVYLLANAAPFLFRGALTILTTLNPFRLFETVLNGTASADLGIISGIAEYVGSLYATVQDFSIVFLLPMLLAVTAFSVLVFQKGGVLKRFARYALRVFMLFAGLPLIGATYTGLIEDLDTQVSAGSDYADYLVLSSYVDFENWVKYSRLAPPDNGRIDNPRFGEDEDRAISDRALILEINGTRANNPRAELLKDRYASTSSIDDIMEVGGSTIDVDEESRTHEQKQSFSSVYSILTRHMNSARYSSSDYDGEVSGQIERIRMQGGDESRENEENIIKMFSLSASDNRTWTDKLNFFDDDPAWMEPIHWNGEEGEGEKAGDDERNSAKGLFTEGNALNALFKFGTYRMNIYNSGDLRYIPGVGYQAEHIDDVVDEKPPPIGVEKEETAGGLSPIAMYNFLNTTFSDTGLTVYSPERTSSDLSRDAYAAVTFGGSGMSAFTRWTENLVVMIGLAILSIAYGITMVNAAIKNIPRILTGVFGTALGSIAFTTKLLISTAVLLIQVIGMLFLYVLSENIMMTILLNFNELVDTGGSYFGNGVLFDFLGSFLVIVITAALTYFLIKNMNVFKELMEEVVSNSINRVMGLLDTSTGGQGLNVSQTSGHRIGNDGKLTDQAKKGDGSGFTGLLGAAHGLEARREALAAEQNMPDRSTGEKIKARIGTAKDLMAGKTADFPKSAAGIRGKSYERALEAKEAGIQSMRYGKATDLGRETSDNFTENDDDNENKKTDGLQQHNQDDKKSLDQLGNALDANGRPISPEKPVAYAGFRLDTTDDGALKDKDGDIYTDEAGEPFYQDEKGQLINEKGSFMALDKDGTLQPVNSLPEHDGKPVHAAREAEKLDAMRFDADQFAAMNQEQDAAHYGLDPEGQVIGTNGEVLSLNKSGHTEPVDIDEQGFLTDAEGVRVTPDELDGELDERGFERIEDPETGEMQVQHKGDAALKDTTSSEATNTKPTSLSSLAKQANKADGLAKRAEARVDHLQATGASPYAVRQAQRHADQAGKKARSTQRSFQQAMQDVPKAKRTTDVSNQPVTDDQLQSATRQKELEQGSLDQEMATWKRMKQEGAPSKQLAKQEQKVSAQKQAVRQASHMEKDLQTAKKAGRSYEQVQGAHAQVEHAERAFTSAQQAHAKAVASGQPKDVIQRHQQKVDQASQAVSTAKSNVSRLSQKPSGTPQEVQQAAERVRHAQTRHQQAVSKVRQLERQGNSIPPAERPQHEQQLKQARQQATETKQQVRKAKASQARVSNPSGWKPKRQETSSVSSASIPSTTKSFATLSATGVTSYGDYQKQLKQHKTDVKQQQSKYKQAQQRVETLRSSRRPPQIIEQAEEQVRTLQQNVQTSQAKVRTLKENAHGLLKSGHFQPSVAKRPIRQSGKAIVHQMTQMGQSQAIYDQLVDQAKEGSLSDSGRTQMQTIGTRLGQMKKQLVQSGIKEDALRDKQTIQQSVNHMQQSWDAFLDGTSVEHKDS